MEEKQPRKLYIIESQQALRGETIAYMQIQGFSSNGVIVTAKGGICIWKTELYDIDDEEIRTSILKKAHAMYFLYNREPYLLSFLIQEGHLSQEEAGLFFADNIRAEEEAKAKAKFKKEQEEYAQYERLKAKYEKEVQNIQTALSKKEGQVQCERCNDKGVVQIVQNGIPCRGIETCPVCHGSFAKR